MSNPWDRPALPNRGDRDNARTYEGVGRVIDGWESVEFEMSRLYSVMAGHPDDAGLLQRYGSGRIFRDRQAKLQEMADRYFILQPNQRFESTFDLLDAHANGFSERRNDVAHGIVFDVKTLEFFTNRFPPNLRNKTVYLLIPPLHTIRHHGADGFPVYAYNYALLMHLAIALEQLKHLFRDFKRALPSVEGPLAVPL